MYRCVTLLSFISYIYVSIYVHTTLPGEVADRQGLGHLLAAMGWWCLVANLAFSRFSPVEETMKGWKNHMFHRTGRNETSWNINVFQHVPMNTAWSQKMGSGKSRIQSWTAGKPGMWPFVMIQACAKGVPVRNLVQRRSSKLWWACNE